MRPNAPLEDTLLDVALRYPPELQAAQIRDIPRIAYNISLVMSQYGTKCRIADIGGGIGLFSVGCAALGMTATLVDDFGDEINIRHTADQLRVHQDFGVKIINKNVLQEPLGFAPESFDAITSFDSMEHWPSSPKALLHEIMTSLKPGGLFVLSVPNCVNLRKRIGGLVGRAKWSDMKEWYEKKSFRGHVREPDVDDLLYIARDINLENVRIVGRNWLGLTSRHHYIRLATTLIDRPLQLFPTLCADLYLTGNKKK